MSPGASYSLTHALPADVASTEDGFAGFYQKYPVFSWPWCWRRLIIFGPFAIVGGVLYGMSHGLTVKDWWEGSAVGAHIVAANFVIVSAGTLLAAIVRHARPGRIEGLLVVTAVLVGMVLGHVTFTWAEGFHARAMYGAGINDLPAPRAAKDMHEMFEGGLNAAYVLLIYFVANGGLALRPYFTEQKRWQKHQRRLELERMSFEKSVADMRLTVLQAQVEPHFLFNTLASVRSLLHADPKRAAHTIDALAAHLRATLPRLRADTGEALSTLAEQLAICQSYLEVMRVRMGERLHVNVRLPDHLRDLPFPPLVLISLIENAIKHGVEPKAGAVHIELEASVSTDDGQELLTVDVKDDGVGFHLGMGEGMGLANVRAQLANRFGEAATLHLAAREQGGVIASLCIPLRLLRS